MPIQVIYIYHAGFPRYAILMFRSVLLLSLISETDSLLEKTVNIQFKRPQLTEPDWLYAYRNDKKNRGFPNAETEM